jgi:circadian clock protein KaiB
MSTLEPFKFRLFVAGDAANSVQAIANLTALCEEHLPSRHHIEIVDVLREPKRALADGILLTPTLVKLSPAPVRRIVGSLSQLRPVLIALGLATPLP